MRTRRDVVLALALAPALLRLGAFAQEAARRRRIGFLASRMPDDPSYPHFAGGLRELGYDEGRNVEIIWRFAKGDYARLPELARELVSLPVEVLVTDGTPGIRAAQAATRTIPIVFAGGADLVASGFVKSLARPGGNTTGASLLLSDTTGKQLEFASTLVPRLSRVAVLFNPANQAAVSLLHGFEAAAAGAKIRITAVECRTVQDIEGAPGRILQERSEALIWAVDGFLIQEQKRIAELALRLHLPSISGHPGFPDYGGLIGYGPDRKALWKQVAIYVDKVLRGADPGELPVQQPTKLDLVLNRRTAKALGLTIPPDLLVLADKVIE